MTARMNSLKPGPSKECVALNKLGFQGKDQFIENMLKFSKDLNKCGLSEKVKCKEGSSTNEVVAKEHNVEVKLDLKCEQTAGTIKNPISDKYSSKTRSEFYNCKMALDGNNDIMEFVSRVVLLFTDIYGKEEALVSQALRMKLLTSLPHEIAGQVKQFLLLNMVNETEINLVKFLRVVGETVKLEEQINKFKILEEKLAKQNKEIVPVKIEVPIKKVCIFINKKIVSKAVEQEVSKDVKGLQAKETSKVENKQLNYTKTVKSEIGGKQMRLTEKSKQKCGMSGHFAYKCQFKKVGKEFHDRQRFLDTYQVVPQRSTENNKWIKVQNKRKCAVKHDAASFGHEYWLNIDERQSHNDFPRPQNYEWRRCFNCQIIGHLAHNCKNRARGQVKDEVENSAPNWKPPRSRTMWNSFQKFKDPERKSENWRKPDSLKGCSDGKWHLKKEESVHPLMMES